MSRVLLVTIGLFVLATSCRSPAKVEQPTNSGQSAAEYISQADQLYAQRDDLVHVRQAVVLLRHARTVDPGSYDAAWKLARYNYYLATHIEGDERDKAFREGIKAGKAATQLQNDRPEGHFWLGANYGASLDSSLVAGLANTKDVRDEMAAVLKLNEGFQDGSAYMVLGLLELKTPKLLGGDSQKAVAEMEKGLRFGPGNAFLRLHLAEAYVDVGRSEDARQQLNAIINMTPDPNYLPEYKEASAAARQLLEKIK
jgi:Tfp pilus assembly protein PilF